MLKLYSAIAVSCVWLVGFGLSVSPARSDEPTPIAKPIAVDMAGYLLVPHQQVAEKYDAGFSLYVSAWPLLDTYPGNRFQTGLFGTWMFAKSDQKRSMETYSDIEGGLGWWRDTRFATETPKFIMGGVAKSFSEWANGPGAGKGRDWSKPNGKYGIAQLSPYVVWPPDGLNLKQGTSGELFGYGYLPLPLAESKDTTNGKPVPTGDQCWTLFLNSGNFKGPVAFFLPYFWSKPSVTDPAYSGAFLDSRPANPNKAIQMETQYVPAFQATDSQGVTFARIAPTSFPRNADGESPVVHQVTAYSRAALWDSVQSWFGGGEPVAGKIDTDALAVHAFKPNGGSTWRIFPTSAKREDKVAIQWDAFATPITLGPTTYGYRWDKNLVTQTENANIPLVTLPQYYRLTTDGESKSKWVAVAPADVPAETGLADVRFQRPPQKTPDAYVTPSEPASSWKTPGPSAGPFDLTLGDGSTVTYFWYRFADQPALLNADLTDQERERMQAKVERLHRHWKSDTQYLPPPAFGALADIDPALLVTPPPGMEVGFVPIVTRQGR
ncbi:hypothetical protein K227x_36720 [Rubripirellula lacrimiformis]|uniref:Uncharacterized protein n=1 Tax=Rubripirellula lacrimiformis TaxID=1930273 RepID=A0A517NDS4_9BACT|nr:hypothetical protein [Rubripirellula lacrimiformis]QDT05272.1 hypothetical protein K227x_36720 [Rubripirellula lacrimiformis]